MTYPPSNLRAIEVIARSMSDDWPRFRAAVHQRKQPARNTGGDGRSTEVSDPTGNAVAYMSTWEEYELDAGELTAKILTSMRALEKMVHDLLYVKPTKDEKAKMRCSGEHDATCTEMAAVPSKRGMCDSGYMQWYRAQQKEKVG